MLPSHVVHHNLVHSFLPPGFTRTLQHGQSRRQRLKQAPWKHAIKALPLCRHQNHRRHRSRRPVYLVCAVPALEEKDSDVVDSSEWKMHVLFCAIGLGLASVHRVTLAILAVPFQTTFAITLPQMGWLQSAMLWGYVVGQIPTGRMADRIGGSPMMQLSIILWCTSTALMPLVRYIPPQHAFAYIFTCRVLLGLFQSGIITGTACMSAKWVPQEHRSKAMGFCYFLYSGGVVLGLWATPAISAPLGWPAVFAIYSAIGFVWTAWGRFALAPESRARFAIPEPERQNSRTLEGADGADESRPVTVEPVKGKFKMSKETKIQVAVMIWTHSVIGWGFTLLQNWIPTILATLGMVDLEKIGIISSLPWLAASGVSLAGGLLADWLHKERGWTWVEVRAFCQNMASLGPALALLVLAVWKGISIPMAVGLLVATAGLQAFAYAGFHSYAQDVCPKDVGKLLGLTNTGGTVVGVICNLMTGKLAASATGFSSVFYICAAVYFTSFITWNIFMKGAPIKLT